jgi:transmembrane sensor
MNQNNIWSLIGKQLAEEITPGESEQLQKWLSEDPSHQIILNDVQKIWETSNRLISDPEHSHLDMESEWLQIQQKLNLQKKTVSKTSDKYYHTHIRSNHKKSDYVAWQFIRVAALILIMFGGAVWLSQYFGESPREIAGMEPQFREISTQPRQLAGITLTDGSKVNLSVVSKVRLSETFNRDIREVFLEGQAYFDVIRDPDIPFIVKTRHTNLKVLGTDFTVKAYPDDEIVQVVVAGGSVLMESENYPENYVIINPGEMGTMIIETGNIVITEIDAEDYLGWLEGRLVFNDVALAEVVRDLERWFEVDFEIRKDFLKTRRLTAVLNNRSLLNVLDIMSLTLDITYHFENDENRVVIDEGMTR